MADTTRPFTLDMNFFTQLDLFIQCSVLVARVERMK